MARRPASAGSQSSAGPPATIEGVFGVEGRLSHLFSNFEYRPQQVEAAQAIANALEAGRKCIVEAGTGVGKSLAYLVPVALSLGPDHRAVISTYTINLQEQLIKQDIPALTALLPEVCIKACLVKGKGNYLCKQDLDVASGDLFHSAEPLFRRISSWARRTRTGDRAELSFDYPHWNEIACNNDTCRVRDCHYFDTCFYYQARRRANACNLIVVNHALLLTDLIARGSSETGEGILPPYDVLVVDEAHHLEDAATSTFDMALGSWELPVLADRMRRAAGAAMDMRLCDQIEDLNAAFFRPFRNRAAEYTIADRLSGDEWQGVVATAQELIGALTAAQGVLEQAAKEVDEQKQTRLEGLRQAAMRLAGTVSLECQANAEGTVHWCETSASRSRRSHSQQDRVVLHRTPIDVADLLRERLWANTERAILTSATLTASGSFSYLRSRLGLAEELDEHVIGSPFDYRSQALLYVPGHLPAPEREPTREYYDRVAEEIARIVKLSRGRAFLLFTSRRALDEAHVRLISALPFPLFRQGDMPPAKLLKAFRESECGCLLGNQTFWEGVDVQGEALSVVVIDRIPFAVPDSPITKARTDAIEAAGGNSFFDYSLPQAQIRLKQGFGRLIRTRTDRGIVCILDSRIHTKRYGEEIVRNLPAASRASIWSRVERFWNG